MIRVIEDGLHITTSRARPLQECTIRDKITSKSIMKLEPSQEIVQVPIDQFSKIFNYQKECIAGSFCTKTRRIFMITGEWCFSHLIHETLHSRSSFSKIYPIPKNLEFVYEGITEMLTGLVLKEKIPDCFKSWQSINSCFLRPYVEFVKPWYYLASKINMSSIKSLYFNTKVQNPYEELGDLLRHALGGKVENIFTSYRPDDFTISDRFNDQLASVFPRDFAEFLMTPLMKIEFDKMKI